jgi:hypothetical protein
MKDGKDQFVNFIPPMGTIPMLWAKTVMPIRIKTANRALRGVMKHLQSTPK